MNSLIRWIANAFQRRYGRRRRGSGASPTSIDGSAVAPKQDAGPVSRKIEARLLVRLLGGEFYGALNSSSCEMESVLWGKLPNELLRGILSMLPFISKLRFRVVCSEWCSLLSSDIRNEGALLGRAHDRSPLVCGYRFIHGDGLRDRGVDGTEPSAALLSTELQRKLRCREIHLSFPDILPREVQGQDCRITTQISPQDGLLCIEVWKERRLLTGKLRRHRGPPTVLGHLAFLLNPITNTVISVPQMQTEGDYSLGRNLGLAATKVEPKVHPSLERSFNVFSFYWTSWWVDLGIGLRKDTSWFSRVRSHPLGLDRFSPPESVHVRDRSGERSLIGIGSEELEVGKFRTVISERVLYGVHYHQEEHNRLFTRALNASEQEQWSEWLDEVTVPYMNDTTDLQFFLVEHRASHSVYYVGQSYHKSGKLVNQICKLESDSNPLFWLQISVMPEAMVDSMMSRAGLLVQKNIVLDGAFFAGDFIIMVFRITSPHPEVWFGAFHIYEEAWQFMFEGTNSQELAQFDGFFEVRTDLHFPRKIGEGLRL